MADLDHVIGLLRDDDASSTQLYRSLRELDQLIAESRTTGAVVTAAVTGDPADVPRATSQEAYRIVQEGLTNVLRHAGPVPVSLRVEITRAGVEIELANSLPAGHTSAAGASGRGLAGMRERVHTLHGQFSAGPADGAWRALAYLPARPPVETER